jgi:hypothetical protein
VTNQGRYLTLKENELKTKKMQVPTWHGTQRVLDFGFILYAKGVDGIATNTSGLYFKAC